MIPLALPPRAFDLRMVLKPARLITIPCIEQ